MFKPKLINAKTKQKTQAARENLVKKGYDVKEGRKSVITNDISEIEMTKIFNLFAKCFNEKKAVDVSRIDNPIIPKTKS